MKVRARCAFVGIKSGKVYKVLDTSTDGNAYLVSFGKGSLGSWYHKSWFVIVPSIWVRLGNFLTHNNSKG